MISRTTYLNKLIGFREKRLIKVVTGVRRCGKSTLLEIFKQYLIKDAVKPEQIVSINFEDADFDFLTDYKVLYRHIKDHLVKNKMNYIFLDEIQHVKEFERAVDSLYIKENTDIYITGSNADLLSSEIASLLSGRYVEIEMLPLSFKEYISYWDEKTDLSRKYNDYLRYSSFPYTLELMDNKNLIYDYLSGIYNTVILKDVITRNNISDVMMLESLIRFLFDHIGNLWSIKKISDSMTSAGRKISTHTVENYLSALLGSYILYRARRFDIKGKQYLKTGEKYYIVDIGLRYFLLGNKNVDIGHILENVVYLELLRRGYEVYIGKVGPYEVDFTVSGQSGIEYYQVSASVRDSQTLLKELRPLEMIPDNYPKYLITLDEDPPASYKGIKHINIQDFLLS